jgi:hypothetical protein
MVSSGPAARWGWVGVRPGSTSRAEPPLCAAGFSDKRSFRYQYSLRNRWSALDGRQVFPIRKGLQHRPWPLEPVACPATGQDQVRDEMTNARRARTNRLRGQAVRPGRILDAAPHVRGFECVKKDVLQDASLMMHVRYAVMGLRLCRVGTTNGGRSDRQNVARFKFRGSLLCERDVRSASRARWRALHLA